MIFNKKKKNIEQPVQQKIREKKALVIEKYKKETSVFFHGKEIIKYSPNKACVYSKRKETIKNKRKEQTIEKRMPLDEIDIDKENNKIKFYKGKTAVVIKLKEQQGTLFMEIDNQTNADIELIVPRGTQKKVEKEPKKKQEKSLFTTKRPNLMLNSELMLSIDTCYEWDIKRTNKEVYIDIGKKASLIFISCTNIEDAIKKYKEIKQLEEIEVEKKIGVYLTVNRKNYMKKVEKIVAAGIDVRGIVLEDIEIRKEIDKAIYFSKLYKIDIIIKLKPYISINRKYQEEKKNLFLRTKDNKLYRKEINDKKYYAVDLSQLVARRWQQNLVRELLDKGVKGIIAEKAIIDTKKIYLQNPENFDFSQVWHIIWQKLIKEAIDEYPNRYLFIRNNGIKSVRHGILMTDEKSWKDMDRIKKDIDKTKLLGSHTVITEIGGVLNKGEKQHKKLKKWKEIGKLMPIKIMGNVPEKVIKRLLKD